MGLRYYPAKLFFENGRLLTYLSVSQIFEFGFGTRVRSLPDALRIATPKKRLPGAGGGFLTSRKKNIKWTKIIKSTGLVMLNVFVNGHSPPDKRVQLKRKVTSSNDLSPPPSLPANGVEYRVGEFVGIIKTYKKGSKFRGHMISKMLSSEYSYLKRSRSNCVHRYLRA